MIRVSGQLDLSIHVRFGIHRYSDHLSLLGLCVYEMRVQGLSVHLFRSTRQLSFSLKYIHGIYVIL